MKKYFFLNIIWLGLLFLTSCDTKNNIEPRFKNTFLKLYGNGVVDEAVDLLIASDSGFVILGTTSESPALDHDIFFVKTDYIGNIIFQKQLGDPDVDEQPVKILENPSTHNYIICGNIKSNQGGFLWKISPEGDLLQESDLFTDFVFSDIIFKDKTYSVLAVTGSYQNSKQAELLINTNDLSFNFQSSVVDGFGIKIMRNYIASLEGTFSVLGYQNNLPPVTLYASDLINDRTFLTLKGTIGDSSTFPINFIRGNKESNFILLGYDGPGSVNQGPVISLVSSDGTVEDNFYLSDLNENISGIADIFPASLYVYPDIKGNKYLLLGSNQSDQGSNLIRLLLLDASFKVIKDKSFGTGQSGDKGVRLEVILNSKGQVKSVMILGTVNFRQGFANSKIALYKLTPDLELDY